MDVAGGVHGDAERRQQERQDQQGEDGLTVDASSLT
jgi:hypothetical protein